MLRLLFEINGFSLFISGVTNGETTIVTNINSVDSGTRKVTTIRLTDQLRESCLPKLLCEMAARPEQTLNDREKNLLNLIK